MEFLKLFIILNLFVQIRGTTSDQQIYVSMNGITSCVNVIFPKFIYRPFITIVYFENVQLDNMKDIVSSFPNLQYITLRNMIYFNCKWLGDIPTLSKYSNKYVCGNYN